MLTTILKRGATMPLETQLNFLLALICLIVATKSIIKVGGDVVATSQESKHALKNTPRMYLRKQLKGCRDIRIYFNDIFFFERGTFTVFIESVVNNVITIVLTF